MSQFGTYSQSLPKGDSLLSVYSGLKKTLEYVQNLAPCAARRFIVSSYPDHITPPSWSYLLVFCDFYLFLLISNSIDNESRCISRLVVVEPLKILRSIIISLC